MALTRYIISPLFPLPIPVLYPRCFFVSPLLYSRSSTKNIQLTPLARSWRYTLDGFLWWTPRLTRGEITQREQPSFEKSFPELPLHFCSRDRWRTKRSLKSLFLALLLNSDPSWVFFFFSFRRNDNTREILWTSEILSINKDRRRDIVIRAIKSREIETRWQTEIKCA